MSQEVSGPRWVVKNNHSEFSIQGDLELFGELGISTRKLVLGDPDWLQKKSKPVTLYEG